MLAERLWSANSDLAEACLRHAFVTGLADGSLPKAVFARYVAQDAFFLDSFFRSYALVAARARSFGRLKCLHELMSGVLDELELHAKYAGPMGIDLQGVRPYTETRAYTDFLLKTAWQEEPGRTIAVMAPCMRLYAWLGSRLLVHDRPGHPYIEWIRTYAADSFQQLATRLENLLDELASDTEPVRADYRYAMQCEYRFFSAPFEDRQ